MADSRQKSPFVAPEIMLMPHSMTLVAKVESNPPGKVQTTT
jgi:hypothetical protein